MIDDIIEAVFNFFTYLFDFLVYLTGNKKERRWSFAGFVVFSLVLIVLIISIVTLVLN